VKTRMTTYTWRDTIEAGGSLNLATGLAIGTDVDTCAGGGLGAIVVVCLPTADAKANAAVEMGFGMGTLISDEGDTRSNEFSITWSYTTSDNPAT
jgi:hypothetical protein